MDKTIFNHEIEDELIIQFIALYALDHADEPLSYANLLNVIQESCGVRYTDLQICLDNLIKTKHITVTALSDRLDIYRITEKGKNVIDFFYRHIPLVIRENIDVYIKNIFLKKRRETAVKAEIVPVSEKEFKAECRLFDDDRMNLLSLSLYIGSREEAERVAVYFKNHSAEVYGKILDIFNDTDN